MTTKAVLGSMSGGDFERSRTMTDITETKLFEEAAAAAREACYEEITAGRLRAKKAGRRTLILAEHAQAWRERLPDERDVA